MFVSFDDVQCRVRSALDSVALPESTPEVYVVRDLFGRIGLSVSEDSKGGEAVQQALHDLAQALAKALGAYSRPVDRTVLRVDPGLLEDLGPTARELVPGVFWVDRLLIGEGWWNVATAPEHRGPIRYTFHSIKGGVGRSTTAAVLAWHLARRGEDVLVVDLDLESPGLASAVLAESARPTFGIADWFVEDLVGQGDLVLRDMVASPAWAHDLSGSVWVVPAHGREPGEYLAKLGRVYMDARDQPWNARLRRFLARLEATLDPTVVLIESRSGLHDIAAATVTDVDAEAVLFAVDSPSTWAGYRILFHHWAKLELAESIRERLWIVSALTPELDTKRYVDRFRENAWNLFRDYLYDSVSGADRPPETVSYDLWSEEAPHNPMVIHWNRGLAAGASLRHLDETAMEQSYSRFLKRFELVHSARASMAVQSAEHAAPFESRVKLAGSLPDSARRSETIRIALSELPEETSHGGQPKPAELYLPPSHRKAVHPDVMLVTGMRGAGKTFWWVALQNPQIRELIARLDHRLKPSAESEVRAGFGVEEAPDLYPGRGELRAMVSEGTDPELIWRTVHARHVADADHPLKTLGSWLERAKYVASNPEGIARLFRMRDLSLDRHGRNSIMLVDALDRTAAEWRDTFPLIRGLLRHALAMRSYRRLRAKVFLRSDQADEAKVADFPDASKILSSAVELTWSRRDLYGMLWQHLGNSSQGDLIRPWLAEGDWPAEEIAGGRIFRVPDVRAADEEVQRIRFHSITGPWMGKDPRRGFPYTWIPNHLGDADGRVSPRSFIAALRTAAMDTAERHKDHAYALHYDSIKRGVQQASRIRVSELREDYPWVDRLLSPLSGSVVPCSFKEIERIWVRDCILESLNDEIHEDEVKLPPRHINRGTGGVRKDLESLGVFRRLADGRVDLPDVFRVGYGLGRKGGVKAVT